MRYIYSQNVVQYKLIKMYSYKAASFLVLAWAIIMIISAAIAYYFMGRAAGPLLVVAALAGTLGFSLGHFMNRGRKQTYIMALASSIILIFLLEIGRASCRERV